MSLSFKALFANTLWFNTHKRMWRISNSPSSYQPPSFGGGTGQISRPSIWWIHK